MKQENIFMSFFCLLRLSMTTHTINSLNNLLSV